MYEQSVRPRESVARADHLPRPRQVRRPKAPLPAIAGRAEQTTKSSAKSAPSIREFLSNPKLNHIRLDPPGSNQQLLGRHTTRGEGAIEAAVRLVQRAVEAWGWKMLGQELLPKFGVDGVFGRETERAVKSFQAEQGLAADGIVGPVTLMRLDAFVGSRGQAFGVAPLRGSGTRKVELSDSFLGASHTSSDLAKTGVSSKGPQLIAGSVNLSGGKGSLDRISGLGAEWYFAVRHPFTVQGSASVLEPGQSLYVYGLVQNVEVAQLNVRYDNDFLYYQVAGPLVDVGPKEKVPFIHANERPSIPNYFGPGSHVSPDFTDRPMHPFGLRPGVDIKTRSTPCGTLRTATGVTIFSVGLVARDVKSGALFVLGVAPQRYSWFFTLSTDFEHNRVPHQTRIYGAASMPLVPGALKLSGPRANDAINAANNREASTTCP